MSEEIDWLGILRTLWRRRLFLAMVVGLSTGLAILYVLNAPRVYESQALVMIEERPARLVDIEQVAPGVAANERSLQGQMVLLRSRAMAAMLVDTLQLDLLAEFNPVLRRREPQIGAVHFLSRILPASLSAWLTRKVSNPVLTNAADADLSDHDLGTRVRNTVIDNVRARITAMPASGSSVLSLSFRSSNPDLAQLAVNTLADIYLEDQIANKRAVAERATGFLQDEIDQLRRRVAEGERILHERRRETGLLEAVGPTLDEQEQSQLLAQLVLARAERAAAEARLREVEELGTSPSGLEVAAGMMGTDVLAELEERMIDVRRRMAEQASELGERHPTMLAARAELGDLAARKNAEMNRIVNRLRTDVEVARSREESLQSELYDLRSQTAIRGASGIELSDLSRDVEADKALLETYLGRFREITSQQRAHTADARVISRAVRPGDPISPQSATIVSLAFFGSLLVGCVLVMGLEQLDNTIRSGDQIEDLLGIAPLGLIPSLGRRERDRSAIANMILEEPNSPYSEAVRTLRTALLLTAAEGSPRTLLLTSSIPEEGKSSLAVSLARLHARAGRRTILVDGDLRRPRVHELCGLEVGPGFSEVLEGQVNLEDAMQVDGPTGVNVLTAGQNVADPTTLFASDAMKLLIRRLRDQSDVVIFDSPPVLSVSDARVLSTSVDRTLFVVRWASTRRHEAMQGLKALLEAGGMVAGAVLTRVDVRKHSRYSYTDSGQYYAGRYGSYYHYQS